MVSMEEVKKFVLKLNSKKSFTHGAIPKTICRDSFEVSDKHYK